MEFTVSGRAWQSDIKREDTSSIDANCEINGFGMGYFSGMGGTMTTSHNVSGKQSYTLTTTESSVYDHNLNDFLTVSSSLAEKNMQDWSWDWSKMSNGSSSNSAEVTRQSATQKFEYGKKENTVGGVTTTEYNGVGSASGNWCDERFSNGMFDWSLDRGFIGGIRRDATTGNISATSQVTTEWWNYPGLRQWLQCGGHEFSRHPGHALLLGLEFAQARLACRTDKTDWSELLRAQ